MYRLSLPLEAFLLWAEWGELSEAERASYAAEHRAQFVCCWCDADVLVLEIELRSLIHHSANHIHRMAGA